MYDFVSVDCAVRDDEIELGRRIDLLLDTVFDFDMEGLLLLLLEFDSEGLVPAEGVIEIVSESDAIFLDGESDSDRETVDVDDGAPDLDREAVDGAENDDDRVNAALRVAERDASMEREAGFEGVGVNVRVCVGVMVIGDDRVDFAVFVDVIEHVHVLDDE